MIASRRAQLEEASSRPAELEKESGNEAGAIAELETRTRGNSNARVREIRRDPEAAEELAVLREWLERSEEAATRKALKAADADLDDQADGRCVSLPEAVGRALVVNGTWLASLEQAVAAEVERVPAVQGRDSSLRPSARLNP